MLRLLAPYLAVGIFWCLAQSAWLAILAYHALILLWSRDRLPVELRRLTEPRRPVEPHRPPRMPVGRLAAVVLPFALTGPVLYLVLPLATTTDLAPWLAARGLSGLSLLLMIPYYGLVHPVLEQFHWGPLRRRTPLAHPLFAGYHLLVLGSLLDVFWLVLCFLALTGASGVWLLLDRRTGSPRLAVLTHVAADVGVVLAAWWSVAGLR